MITVLTILAVARVTRLITTDVLFETPRNAVIVWLMKDPGRPVRDRVSYLLHCPWCASVYVGAAAAGAWYAWGETICYMAVVLALAASYVTGFLASVTNGGS